MKIENLIVRFGIFFSVAFVITFIIHVLMIHTNSIHPHYWIDTTLSSIYISILFPSSIFLIDIRKRESNIEFKRTRNIFLFSVFLFLWIISTIPVIIEKHLMGAEINWTRFFFAGLVLAAFGIIMICLLDFVRYRTKNKE
jgi:hypothetical protein